MDEGDFWARLEYRVCHEFAGMKDGTLQHLWCDGFIPEQYLVSGDEPRIIGRVWICNGRRQDEWQFTFFLPRPISSREELDWASMLPGENVTRWLALDQIGKQIQIEPSVAVRDLA